MFFLFYVYVYFSYFMFLLFLWFYVFLLSKNKVWSCTILSRKLVKDISCFPVALCFFLVLDCMWHLRSDLLLLINQWQDSANKTEALQ